MIVQIISFENITVREYYSQKFGISLPENIVGYLGLLFTDCEITYLSPITKRFVYFGDDDLLAFGKTNELLEFVYSLGNEYPEAGILAERVLTNYLSYNDYLFNINGKSFSNSSPLIMGILNITPDSFSDGGDFFDREKALEHAIEMITCGADIIDIGGESSRPGAKPVSADEELERVIPIIRKISRMDKDVLISIDTTKSVVAEEAILAGANIVNDISAFTIDPKILDVVKKYNVPYVLMHIKGTPETMQNNPFYEEPVSEIYNFLSSKISYLNSIGISNIIIDPGIGFGKRVPDNYEILSRLNEFKGFGLPMLLGVSRKSFLGNSLSLPVDKRENATVIAETISLMNGASIIRTHNVCNGNEIKRIVEFLNNPKLTGE